MAEETRPTTHTNNGGDEQPVDHDTQQFTSTKSEASRTGLSILKSKLLERAKQPFNQSDCFTLRNFDAHHEEKRKKLFDPDKVIKDPDFPKVISAFNEKLSGPSTSFVKDGSYKRLMDYLTSGLKNQFQTCTTSGAYTDRRYEASGKLFGTNVGGGSSASGFKKEYGEKLEKYGHIVDSGPIGLTQDGWTGYGGRGGSIRVELDKDKLKGRVTFTMSDSLCCEYDPCLVGKTDECAFARGRFIDSKKFGKIRSLMSGGKLNCGMGDMRNAIWSPYIEAQFHGEIKPEHFKSIAFEFDNFATGGYEKKKLILETCEKLGITIYAPSPLSRDYYCKPVRQGNSWYMKTFDKEGNEITDIRKEKIIL